MEFFDRENIDELLEIHQIRQHFPPSKFYAVWYIMMSYASKYVTGFTKTIPSNLKPNINNTLMQCPETSTMWL